MGIEIERKFLVDTDKWKPMLTDVKTMVQGYLSDDPDRVVRVRAFHEIKQAFLTVKGITVGRTRQEFEYEIPYQDALEMLKLCERKITKTRHFEEHHSKIWEIDIFDGMEFIVAEVELDYADEPVELPSFLIKEVTGDAAYYNSNM